MDNTTLHAIAKVCPDLQHLNIACCGALDDVGMTTIIPLIPKLNSLNTAKVLGVTDFTLCEISSKLHHLQELNVAACAQITDKGVTAVLLGCKLLQTLHVTNCFHVTYLGSIWLTKNVGSLQLLGALLLLAEVVNVIGVRCRADAHFEFLAAVTGTSLTVTEVEQLKHELPLLQVHHVPPKPSRPKRVDSRNNPTSNNNNDDTQNEQQ